MPTYSYVCDACDHAFDKFQSMTAATLRKCPECGAIKLRRLIGIGAGVIFKGSGFYQTDYRGDGYRKSAAGDTAAAPAASGSESKSGAKSDSKPAVSSAAKAES